MFTGKLPEKKQTEKSIWILAVAFCATIHPYVIETSWIPIFSVLPTRELCLVSQNSRFIKKSNKFVAPTLTMVVVDDDVVGASHENAFVTTFGCNYSLHKTVSGPRSNMFSKIMNEFLKKINIWSVEIVDNSIEMKYRTYIIFVYDSYLLSWIYLSK